MTLTEKLKVVSGTEIRFLGQSARVGEISYSEKEGKQICVLTIHPPILFNNRIIQTVVADEVELIESYE